MTLRRNLSVLAAAGAVMASVVVGGHVAGADGPFTLTTPYPTIETQPGSTVKLDVDVASADDRRRRPDDRRPPGRVDGDDARRRVRHPLRDGDAGHPGQGDAGDRRAADGDRRCRTRSRSPAATAPPARRPCTVTLDVAEQVDSGIELTADFPSLKGDPATDFSYNLTVTNNTPEEQTFTFDPTAPQGWTVTASPTAEARAETVTIDAGANATVKVTATPPATAAQGSYPIDVAVSAANGAQGQIELTAEVTGTPKLALATADQRLDVSGPLEQRGAHPAGRRPTPGRRRSRTSSWPGRRRPGGTSRSTRSSSPRSSPTRRPRSPPSSSPPPTPSPATTPSRCARAPAASRPTSTCASPSRAPGRSGSSPSA